MARGLARSLLLLLVALAVAVPQASGRSMATTTLVVQVLGGGNVRAGSTTIDCGGGNRTCFAQPTTGGSLVLTATAPSGWTFSGWSDGSTDCSGTLTTCTVPMDGLAHEEIADFAPITPQGTSTLSVTASTGGVATGGQIECVADGSSCDWTVTTGSTLTLVEAPDTGYAFDGWAGACTGTARSCTVVMDADHSVSAIFTLSSATRVLSVSVSGGGTVSGGTIACTSSGGSGCSANETLGAQVTLTATPDSGNSFQGWSGDCTGTAPTCAVAMTGNRSVTATFSGGSGAGSTARLTVTVSGPGRVSGGGIDCGNGASDCSADAAAGARVTLTATPASGASFQGWGGACSGSDTTCALTMSAARSVSASFAGQSGGTGKAVLTIRVAGRGSVSTSAGRCQASGGSRTCRQSFSRGSTVPLTAAAARGARFLAWSGACTGASPTCSVVLSGSRQVTATFSGASAASSLRSGGRPLVRRAGERFEVVLRFASARAGTARLRALRAGRVMAGFSFTVPAGPGSVGPFALSRAGFYTFELRVGGGLARWTACLGRCGAAAPGSFTLAREPVEAVRAGALWSLTVHFRESRPAALQLRIRRDGARIRDLSFLRGSGSVEAGPFLLTPGTYALRLTATDGYGRVKRLKWIALLE